MKKKKIIYIILLATIICYMLTAYCVRRKNDENYKEAKRHIKNKNYNEAMLILEELGEYMDAKIILEDVQNKAFVKSTYEEGNQYLEDKNYLKAIEKYESVIEYEDSLTKMKEACYCLALQYMSNKTYDKAKEYFIKANDYKDSMLYLSKLEVQTAEEAKKNIYEEALEQYNDDEYEMAIELFKMIEDYKESKQYIENSYFNLRRMDKNNILTAGIGTSIAVTNENKVLTAGKKEEEQCNVNEWKNIVSVDTYDYYTIGLRKDNKVSVAGICDNFDLKNTSTWENIVDIAAGEQFVMGLSEQGQVYVEGTNASRNIKVDDWENVKAIDAGWDFAVGLGLDGKLFFTGACEEQLEDYNTEKDKWKNVVNISSGGGGDVNTCRSKGHTVGLCKDGTVVVIGDNKWGQKQAEGWTDIIKVVAGDWYIVGLQENGKVLITGENKKGTKYINEDILDLCQKDIVDISAGFGHTLCLKEDGSVLLFGFDEENIQNKDIKKWENLLVQ